MKRYSYPNYVRVFILAAFIFPILFCNELNAQTYTGDLILTTVNRDIIVSTSTALISRADYISTD